MKNDDRRALGGLMADERQIRLNGPLKIKKNQLQFDFNSSVRINFTQIDLRGAVLNRLSYLLLEFNKKINLIVIIKNISLKNLRDILSKNS